MWRMVRGTLLIGVIVHLLTEAGSPTRWYRFIPGIFTATMLTAFWLAVSQYGITARSQEPEQGRQSPASSAPAQRWLLWTWCWRCSGFPRSLRRSQRVAGRIEWCRPVICDGYFTWFIRDIRIDLWFSKWGLGHRKTAGNRTNSRILRTGKNDCLAFRLCCQGMWAYKKHQSYRSMQVAASSCGMPQSNVYFMFYSFLGQQLSKFHTGLIFTQHYFKSTQGRIGIWFISRRSQMGGIINCCTTAFFFCRRAAVFQILAIWQFPNMVFGMWSSREFEGSASSAESVRWIRTVTFLWYLWLSIAISKPQNFKSSVWRRWLSACCCWQPLSRYFWKSPCRVRKWAGL